MEVALAVQNIHSYVKTSTPYMSAPSSPMHFIIDPFDYRHDYISAPTSPTATGDSDFVNNNFTFDFFHEPKECSPLQVLTSADELFDQGKIRLLKPPPRVSSSFTSRQSVRSMSNSSDSGFTAGMAEATMIRGRERTPSPDFSSAISHTSNRKAWRSLSPLRANKHLQPPIFSHPSPIENISCAHKGESGEGRRKWRFKNFLLFRSASEGRGRTTGDRSKDPLRKFTTLPSSVSSSSLLSPKLKKKLTSGDDSTGSSFRTADSNGSARRCSAQSAASPHAIHYVAKRAAAEEMKKRTALPYRQSLLNCLPFTPAIHMFTTKGLGGHFSTRGWA